MTSTPDLIALLATNVRPVRPMRSPVARASAWLLLSALVLALLSFSQGVRADILACLQQQAFVLSLAGALLTGVSGSVAAFLLSLPDRSRLWVLLPLPALTLWLSTVGYQCLTDWVRLEAGAIEAGEAVRCLATLVLTSLPLSLVMLLMVRAAAPLRPTAVSVMGALAVAGITAVAMALIHELDASVMNLIWTVGTGALFLATGAACGGRLLNWAAWRFEHDRI